MCGITGIWHKDDSPIDRHQMEQFTHSLEHRGPDGQNCYFTANRSLALGNRRLAIVDSHQRGNQPMAYAEQRYWLTFNGEIYNFVELRAELQREGYSFTTQTDSEVILAAYIHWGAGCQQRFNGMWAFAIWDSLEQILFLSRDRFGVKPLYVYDDGKRFAFASEVKAFLALAWSNVEFNFNYLY